MNPDSAIVRRAAPSLPRLVPCRATDAELSGTLNSWKSTWRVCC